MGNVDKNGYRLPQPKIQQINFNGNPLVARMRNGYGTITENKSQIFNRAQHF